METKKKVNIPKKGAGRKLADRLEELANRKPPKGIVEKLKRKDEKQPKVAASPARPNLDVEI